MRSAGFAAAKINLFLHVGRLGADGYHPISSLVAFADVGDELSLRPGVHPDLVVEGEFAAELGASGDNLVIKARDRLLAAFDRSTPPFGIRLLKRLPVASGIGGGSADAAAALRLIAGLAGMALTDVRVARIASDLGSDVPVCIASRPSLVAGRGERLAPPPAFPDLPAVLVNPRRPVFTAAAYRAFDALELNRTLAPPEPPPLGSLAAVIDWLGACRNDLQAPAVALEPVIAEVLDRLGASAGLARLSGSGATCFGLCDSVAAAKALADAIGVERPDWWVRATVLEGSST